MAEHPNAQQTTVDQTALMDRLAAALDGHHRHGRRCALLHLDIDRFRDINHSLGRVVGDCVLAGVAQRLGAVGSPDRPITIAHLHADAFAVLIEDLRDSIEGAEAAHRLVQMLAAGHQCGDVHVHATASIGVVVADGDHRGSEDMLRDAEIAMCRARRAGGAGYAVFESSMRRQVLERAMLERDLRRALQLGEFEMHYQPIVTIDDGRLVAFESMLRWTHPKRGPIPPDRFVPVAESIGLIGELGIWALRESCRQLAAWRRELDAAGKLRMSVNLSKHQLAVPGLVDEILAAVKEHGLTPRAIQLEVTESDIMGDVAALVPLLHVLRNAGLRIAIDDFGTGQSSLAALHRFPIDVLKIDRAFIHCMGEDRAYAAIVAAIITLAENLDVEVVAEGVETVEQVAELCSLDCHAGQGFVYAEPVIAAEAALIIADPPWLSTARRNNGGPV